MKRINKFLTFLLLAICVVVVASCNSTTGGEENLVGGQKTSDGKLVIEYWHANGAVLTTVLEEIKDDFMEKHPEYYVKLVSYGDYTTLRDTIAFAIRGGNTPTAAQTYPDHVSLYLEGKALQSLDKYINDPVNGMTAEEQAQFIDGFWNEGVIYDEAGTRYAMPFNKSTELMYYNTEVFAENKWDVPTTWEEVVAIAKKWKTTQHYKEVTAKYGVEQCYALGYDSEANLFITLTQQNGAVYTSFNSDGKGIFNAFGAVEEDTTKSKNAMKWYLDNFKEHYVTTKSAFGTNFCSDAFLNGQCIMTIGSSAGATYNDGTKSTYKKFNTGVASVPQKDTANGQVIQQGTNVSLFKCEDNAAEELGGWLWLKHMVSFESALTWAIGTSYFPIRKDVLNSEAYQDHVTGMISDNEGNKVQGVQSLAAKAKQQGLQQQNWFYTNIAFAGSSKARDKAEALVAAVLFGDTTIDDAYAEAYNALK